MDASVMEIGPMVCLPFVGALGLVSIIKRIAWRYGAVSWPDGVRRLHRQPTPLWGGVAVYFAFALGAALLLRMGPSLGLASPTLTGALLVCGGMLCALGMIDDRYPLNAWSKLPSQFLAVLPLVCAGFTAGQVECLGWEFSLGPFAVPCTIGWLLLGTNALNLLDGSDGLASSQGLLMALTVAVLAGLQGRVEVAILAVILASALAGFLVHNLPPARIYLGDCGSTLIGFLVASLALCAARTEAGSVNLSVAVLVMFVPLLDTGLAIVRRALRGQAIWSGDRGHLHHQLQDLGFTAGKILGLLGTLGMVSGLAAGAAILGKQEWLALLVPTAGIAYLVWRRWIAQQEWGLLTYRFTRLAGLAAAKSASSWDRQELSLRSLRLRLSDQLMQTRGPITEKPGELESRAA